MRDVTSIPRVALLHPKIRVEVVNRIEKAELNFNQWMAVRVVQGLRTFAEQNHLFALGRTIVNPDGHSASKPMGNIVTYAKGGQSYHNYGLAFDFALLYDKDHNGNFETLSWNMNTDFDVDHVKDWLEVVYAFKEKDFQWGGDWAAPKTDPPHIQKLFGKTWRQLVILHDSKKVDKNGYVLL